MRAWTTSPAPSHCGKCGAEIKAAERRQIITAAGQKWKLTRCEHCATADQFTNTPTPAKEGA